MRSRVCRRNRAVYSGRGTQRPRAMRFFMPKCSISALFFSSPGEGHAPPLAGSRPPRSKGRRPVMRAGGAPGPMAEGPPVEHVVACELIGSVAFERRSTPGVGLQRRRVSGSSGIGCVDFGEVNM